MSEEQYDSIYEGTGKIVSKTSNVHFLAAQIISYYYLGNDNNPHRLSFVHDVLTNECTNISFITNALKRVLLNLGFDKKYIEKDIEGRMLKIGNLRNKFAHEVLLFNRGHWLPDRKSIPWHGEGLKFEDEFKKFEILYDEINDELNKIINNKQIKMIDHIPNNYKPPAETFTSSQNKPQEIS